MIVHSARECHWRAQLVVLVGLAIGLLGLTSSAWAAPHQQSVRQTVPTRTYTKQPTLTATQTAVPTPTSTVAPTKPTDAPTEPISTSATATQSPAPTARPSSQPTTAPTQQPTSNPQPSATAMAQLPITGEDWGPSLARSAGLAICAVLLALALAALTFARSTPTGRRVR